MEKSKLSPKLELVLDGEQTVEAGARATPSVVARRCRGVR